MIDLISLKLLATSIPHPLFVFSPGLIIQIFYDDLSACILLKVATNFVYSGSFYPDLMWKVSGIATSNGLNPIAL